MESLASSWHVLEGCRERAAVAVAAISRWLCTSASGSIAGPVSSPLKRRAIGASEGLTPSNIFLSQGSPLRRHKQLSWAHTRTSTSGEMHAPVDATLLKSLCATAFDSFLEGLRSAVLSGIMWTLHVEGVQVLYQGGFVDDDDERRMSCAAIDDDFSALDAGLAAFLELMPCEGRRGCRPGAMRMVGTRYTDSRHCRHGRTTPL